MNAELLIQGQHLTLFPERAMFWDEPEVLLVADLHIGKASVFRSHGIAVPGGTTDDDLNRLSSLINRTRPRILVVLGDLMHGVLGADRFVLDTIRRWRRRHADLTVCLVAGNHDRQAEPLIREFGVQLVQREWVRQPFRLLHRPVNDSSRFVIAGHLHPAVRLRGRGRAQETRACFWIGRKQAVLPAFGSFTGCHVIHPGPGDRIFIPADNTVIEAKVG